MIQRRRLRQLIVLCLMVLVPLQGLAIKTAHACPLLRAIQQLHLVKAHGAPAAVTLPRAGHAAPPASIPAGAHCIAHGAIAWLDMPEDGPQPPVVPALRIQLPASLHFSSFIPQQPRRPPLSHFA